MSLTGKRDQLCLLDPTIRLNVSPVCSPGLSFFMLLFFLRFPANIPPRKAHEPYRIPRFTPVSRSSTSPPRVWLVLDAGPLVFFIPALHGGGEHPALHSAPPGCHLLSAPLMKSFPEAVLCFPSETFPLNFWHALLGRVPILSVQYLRFNAEGFACCLYAFS